jgi:hypothetical protein
MRLTEVLIESRSRIIPTDRRVAVDRSVVLRQLRPQGSTREVVTFGVVTNGDFRRRWRVWLSRNSHGLNAASHSSYRGTAAPDDCAIDCGRAVLRITTRLGDLRSRKRRQSLVDGLARFSSGADRPAESAKLTHACHSDRKVTPKDSFGISAPKRVRQRLRLRARLLIRER